MLSIRMQRLGRKGHAAYRVIVQDSRQSPSSGKYIARLGSYDPHTKSANLSEDKIKHFLKGGARPSERVVKLFKSEKITLPKWVEKPPKYKKETRNPDKLRKNRPAGAEAPPKPEEGKDKKDGPAQAEAGDKPAEEEKKDGEETKPENDKKTEAETKPEPAPENNQPEDKKEESQEKSDKDEPEKPKEEDKKQ